MISSLKLILRLRRGGDKAQVGLAIAPSVSTSTSTVRRSRTTSVEDDERVEPARKRRACA